MKEVFDSGELNREQRYMKNLDFPNICNEKSFFKEDTAQNINGC
jgi:hypothetical protein